MGRELKRVPLDFDWPLNVIWKGYLNPYACHLCKACEGSGYSPKAKELCDSWYRGWCRNLDQDDVDALIENNRLTELTHTRKAPRELVPIPGVVVTAAQVNEFTKTNPFVLDACAQYVCVEAKAKKLGIETNCPLCLGDGSMFCDEKFRKLYEEWQAIEPPEGPGFQLWSTTSEGHPMSPVFDSLESLCKWLAECGISVFGRETATYNQWFEMLSANFVYVQKGRHIFI